MSVGDSSSFLALGLSCLLPHLLQFLLLLFRFLLLLFHFLLRLFLRCLDHLLLFFLELRHLLLHLLLVELLLRADGGLDGGHFGSKRGAAKQK